MQCQRVDIELPLQVADGVMHATGGQGAGFVGTRCSAKVAWELPVGSAGQMALMSTVEQEVGMAMVK
jgi:hypothetical protein